jgi:hypothetical protein
MNNGLPAGYDAWRLQGPHDNDTAPEGQGEATISAVIGYDEDDGTPNSYTETYRLYVTLDNEGEHEELKTLLQDSGKLGEGERVLSAELENWEPAGPPDREREWDE